MSTTIINYPKPSDVREGDVLYYTWDGAPAVGVARNVCPNFGGTPYVWVNGLDIAGLTGKWLNQITVQRLEREIPDLPTTPESVIVGTVRGEPGRVAIREFNEAWWTPIQVKGTNWHHAADITDWEIIHDPTGVE